MDKKVSKEKSWKEFVEGQMFDLDCYEVMTLLSTGMVV